MRQKINRIMNVLIVVVVGFFAVEVLIRFLDFKNHPEIYEAQSAPWHVALFIPGAASLLFLMIALVVKILIQKNKKKAVRSLLSTNCSDCRKRSHRIAFKIKFSDMCGEFGFLEAVAKRKQYP